MNYLLTQDEYDRLQRTAAKCADSLEDTRDLDARALEFKTKMIDLLLRELPELLRSGSYSHSLNNTVRPFIERVKEIEI